ncbi:DUF3078 domain-containing protein [Maribacter algarum]|uniref:DUF3078 domain-containing protein n=1 Tax=Maribacter algarum (ex Zhang et al. 2020) TaxID=2578118 RepID=A0A5S3PUW4_9FLAO|nr:DUF3078 domain-containing protein [Maribacter algarum]TMM58708.1 DUF3078 domain-containing protein [Maribacter algarum]
MNFEIMKPQNFFFILFLAVQLGYSQDSIPNPLMPDSTIVAPILRDSMRIDTIVIRRTQPRVKQTAEPVNIMNTTISFKKTKPLSEIQKKFEVPTFWQSVNLIGLNFSQAAFINWNAGGNNSIAAQANARFERNYKFRYFQWNNILETRYGINLQEGQKIRKTDDAIRISSTVGYRRDTISNWYYSVKANFNTQYTDGFKYPDRETPISRVMSPGYFFLGAGTSYISKGQKLNIYISPITQKATFVLDQELADKGAFGVEKAVLDPDGNIVERGKNLFLEVGFLITNDWETQLMENIALKHRLNLYTDYIRSFGNIDIDWELNVNLKVNKYIVTNLGTHIIYDDDILFDALKNEAGEVINEGRPKLQFKQLLGVGVAYNF